MNFTRILLCVLFVLSPLAYGDERAFGSLEVERLEHQAKQDLNLVDLDAWYGTDEYRFVAKLEAESHDSDDVAELNLLYSRPWTAFFDAQVGIEISNDYSGIIAGIEGEAPYRIDTELAAVITEDGDALLRAELQRILLITQKLSVQPRAKLTAAIQDVPELGVAAGFNDLFVELRLRYDLHRKFTPYIGVSWQRALGDTATMIEAAGGDKEITTGVAGISFWF